MSHQIVECPGCLTKLRVKESQTVIRLACPRCGEQLAIDPPEPTHTPQPPAQKRAAPPSPAPQRPNPLQAKPPARQRPPAEPPRATRPSSPAAPKPGLPPRPSADARPGRGSSGTRHLVGNQADDWETPEYESYGATVPARRPQQSFWQKYGLLLGILGGGGGVLMLLFIGGVVWWMKNSNNVSNQVATTPTGTIPATTTPDFGNAEQNAPPAIANSGTPAAANPAVVTPPAIAPPASPFLIPNAGNGNGAGNGNAAGAAVSSENRKLRYEWKPGSEFVYPALTGLITDGFLRNDVKTFLIGIGPAIEDPILKKIDSITDVGARNELIEVLKKVGTKKSIDKLEELAKSGSSQYNATQALDAIRARQ